MEKFLEDSGIKLSVVVSDVLGKSARAMLEALEAGERDPQVLSALALGSMRGKIPVLSEALTARTGGPPQKRGHALNRSVRKVKIFEP
ncbi:hypothetical protein [Kitasatospora sp. NPDC017646]|uniref:hypothetical protein n=1 Tax=Kitasatospora sp. NPDC017646 TaxID=3364024 RepID=UPI00379B4EFC